MIWEEQMFDLCLLSSSPNSPHLLSVLKVGRYVSTYLLCICGGQIVDVASLFCYFSPVFLCMVGIPYAMFNVQAWKRSECCSRIFACKLSHFIMTCNHILDNYKWSGCPGIFNLTYTWKCWNWKCTDVGDRLIAHLHATFRLNLYQAVLRIWLSLCSGHTPSTLRYWTWRGYRGRGEKNDIAEWGRSEDMDSCYRQTRVNSLS